MGPHYLQRLFDPESIAVVGASEREGSLGEVVLRNIKRDGFAGPIYAVNPRYDKVQGIPCFPSVKDVPGPVDLVIVATPARAAPGIIEDAGQHGVGAAVILSAGFSEMGPEGKALEEQVVEVARRTGVRLVGPNCVGIIRPGAKLNATFSYQGAMPGRLGLLSQSGAIITAILDWAPAHRVGFSAVVSLGISADVGFGDTLDFLAMDPQTDAILLYVEGVRDRARFISGLRAAARLKPVIVVKAGRHAGGAKAAASHTGAIVGGDDVFEAALRRAGAVRVIELDQLFAVAEILASKRRVRGNKLGIVTNAGGPGVLAADRAGELGLNLPEPSAETIARLDTVLPAHWSRGNPVDVLGDAPPERYREAIDAVASDPGIDGVLVMFTPQAITEPLAVARQLVEMEAGITKPLLACWLGEEQVAAARRAIARAGIPHFNTPEAAVEAFAAVTTYRRNQELLLQVPGPLTDQVPHDVERARDLVQAAIAEGRRWLHSTEARALLTAYNIPVVQARPAADADSACRAAAEAGYPVALKIDSPDITHKTDVGGVQLNISDEASLREAVDAMLATVKQAAPDARITGVLVEPMHTPERGRELLVGAIRDPAFGPAIAFGSGGTLVEVMRDRAVALPPLNSVVAGDLVDRTRAAVMLGPLRGNPAADREAVEKVLVAVSALVCDLPEVVELDINPLVANEDGVMAVDVRVAVEAVEEGNEPYAHLAIEPYPAELSTTTTLDDGASVTIRPIRPEDAEAEQSFVRKLSPRSRTYRFRNSMQELTPQMLVRFTQIDYRREMALVATLDASAEQVGVARYVIDPDQRSAEFAIVIADDLQGHGLGRRLMRRLMEVAASRGLNRIYGQVQRGNQPMLELMRALGFELHTSPEDQGLVDVSAGLDQPGTPPSRT